MQGLNKRLLEHMFANGSSNMDTSKLVGLMIGKWKLGFFLTITRINEVWYIHVM